MCFVFIYVFIRKEKCNELNINYNIVSVYPWENVEEELDKLNNS